jgi:putative acetyltransferase
MLAALEGSEVLGIGAVKRLAGYAELKRVIVSATHRGRGIGRQIVLALKSVAAAQGLQVVQCETGVSHAAARKLYAKLGYVQIPAFGSYEDNAVSVFLRKTLPSKPLVAR